MKTWTIIALLGFMSFSLFGLFSLHHQGGHVTECLASQLIGSDAPCPEADPLGFANFHNQAVKKILNLILVDAASIIYLSVLVFLIFISLFNAQLIKNSSAIKSVKIPFRLEFRNRKLETNKLFWLALHEKRDPSFIFHPA